MKVQFTSLVFVCLVIGANLFGQSKTTEALNSKYKDSKVFFFYNNTLRMLNQDDDKDFDELIKGIEKMKLLWIDKSKNFGASDYTKLTADYKSESFEPIVSSRHEGRNFDIYMKEGKAKGMLILVNDSSSLYVLDIVGQVALDKITKLYNKIDESSEIGKRIKALAGNNVDNKNLNHKN